MLNSHRAPTHSTRKKGRNKLENLTPPIELFLIGASCRSAAESARRAFPTARIVASDLFGDADLREVCDEIHTVASADFPSGFGDLVDSSHPSSLWMYCGGVENAPDLVSKISEQRTLLGCDATTLQIARDPIQVAVCLRDAALPFAAVRTRTDCAGEPTPKSNSRWLSKPLLSCAGHGIQLLSPSQAISNEVPKGRYLQQWIEGELQSGSFVSDGRTAQWLGTTAGLTLQDSDPTHPATAANPFGYAGSTGPLILSHEAKEHWQRIGESLAFRFQLQGLFGVDAIATTSGDLVPLEVNPRYTASMELIELASEQSLVGLHFQTCQSENKPRTLRSKPSHGIRTRQIVYARGQRSLDVSTFCDYIDGWKKTYPGIQFSDTPFFGPDGDLLHFDVGQPIMTVIHPNDSPLKEPDTLQKQPKDAILSPAEGGARSARQT